MAEARSPNNDTPTNGDAASGGALMAVDEAPSAEPGLAPELEAKYSRKFIGEVSLFAQLFIGVVAMGAFLAFLVFTYVDVLFSIDFTDFQWSYLNEFARLFVILLVAAFNVHLIIQIVRYLGRRMAVTALLKELADVLEPGGESLWNLRPMLWDEANAKVVEEEPYFKNLRKNLDHAHKQMTLLREDLGGVIKAYREKRDLTRYLTTISDDLYGTERAIKALDYPYFMDLGYSQGVKFYAFFREQVRAMLNEITRLMNQFENMAKVEDERKLERERNLRLELERQHKLNAFPLETHLDIFLQRIEELTPDKLKGKMHTKFLQLYRAIKDKFQASGLIPAEKLERISDDVYRVNQIEDLINFYDEKVRGLKNESLDLHERRDKARYWQQLRDQHIMELQQGKRGLGDPTALPSGAEGGGK